VAISEFQGWIYLQSSDFCKPNVQNKMSYRSHVGPEKRRHCFPINGNYVLVIVIIIRFEFGKIIIRIIIIRIELDYF